MTKPSRKPKLPEPLVVTLWAHDPTRPTLPPVNICIRDGDHSRAAEWSECMSLEVGLPAALVPLPRALKPGETVEVRIVKKKGKR